jgi:hypothetical protein
MTLTRQNRKLDRQQGSAARSVVVGCVVLVAIGLAYVWLDSQCATMAREIRKLEGEREALAKRQLNEEYRWARLKSPQSLDRVLEQRGLVMAAPRYDQVIRMWDGDGGMGLLASASRRVAGRESSRE